VKASGGCSAPAAKDTQEAKANLGLMRFRQFAAPKPAAASTTREAQIMIRHPNNSGLQMDQITHLYVPLFIVSGLRVWQGDRQLLAMDGGISISEDPNIRFAYRPNGAAEFRAEASDTEGHVFRTAWPAEPSDM
jgi:sulfur-oxidizing protein SoxY